MGLLRTLKPEWWFAAHLHCRFDATVVHQNDQGSASTLGANPDEITIGDDFDDSVNDVPKNEPRTTGNPDEIALDDEEEEVAPVPTARAPPSLTRFIALDKCLPKRDFLEVCRPRLQIAPWLMFSLHLRSSTYLATQLTLSSYPLILNGLRFRGPSNPGSRSRNIAENRIHRKIKLVKWLPKSSSG